MNTSFPSPALANVIRRFVIVFGVLLTSTCSWSQDYVPALGPAFLADEVATVKLTLDPQDLDFILNPNNAYSNIEWPGTFVYESSLGIDTVTNVGIRLRGNTSRNAAKKSFKVSFNSFTAGGKWNDLEKLNLNGNHNDPSMLRARLVWDYMREQGYVAPRISHVKLYINEEYRGLYINVEHVDEEFLKKRFKHDHGNLWKCTYPSDLADLGDDPESYKLTPYWDSEQRIYELKTNKVLDDYTAIRDLCHTVGTASDSEFQCALESVFDVDGFLKLAAVEILVGHWDNYIGNQNNFYLYERPSDGRLMMISYDVDNTLGIEWGGNWVNQNVYDYDQWGTKPLYDRMMDVEQYRTRLGWYIRELIDNGDFSGTAWLERGNTLLNMCLPAAIEDAYRTMDYGFDIDDYLNCLTTGSGGHVTQGIAENVQARATSAYAQTSDAQFPRDIQSWVYTPVVDDTLRVKSEAAGAPLSVLLHISVDGGPYNTHVMSDNGMSGDGEAGDARFGMKMHLPNADQVSWYTSAIYSDGATPTDPCVPGQVWISRATHVPFRINELMSQNTSYITDEAGGHADWVELVNVSDNAANVSDLVLTNRRSEPQRFAFPSATIEAGEHLLTWLDNDPEEGDFHAPFNIESGGDDLILSVWDTFGWRCVDHIEWNTPQLSNTSLGRVTDGADEWTTFIPNTASPPTPNAPNAGPSGNPCPEDLDGDGAIGVSDILIVLGEFGCSSDCTTDIDQNQSVGVSDVLAVLSVFGNIC